MFFCNTRHRKAGSVIADKQTSNHNAKRPRGMHKAAQRIDAHYQGQRHDDLDDIIVDHPHREERDVTQDQPDEDADDNFLEQQFNDGTGIKSPRCCMGCDCTFMNGFGRMAIAPRCNANQCKKDNNTNAIVEQTLARDLGLQILRHIKRANDR